MELIGRNITESEKLNILDSYIKDAESTHWTPEMIKKYINAGADVLEEDKELKDIFMAGINNFIQDNM